MRTQKWLISVGVGIGVVAVLVLSQQPRHKPVAPPSQPEHSQPAAQSPAAPAMPTTQTPPKVVVAPPPVEAAAEKSEEPLKVVRVRANQVLASVNGASIMLKDLAGLPAAQAGADQAMSPEMYEALLQRAINREVIVQSARAQSVELTAEQQKHLAAMRARMERQQPDVVQLTMSPERVEFESRDAAALLLQVNLAAKAGLPSPYVTPELVERYYQEHKADYGELPADAAERRAAWQPIDSEIRLKLAPIVQAAHDEQMRKFVDDLKANANIVMVEPAQ